MQTGRGIAPLAVTQSPLRASAASWFAVFLHLPWLFPPFAVINAGCTSGDLGHVLWFMLWSQGERSPSTVQGISLYTLRTLPCWIKALELARFSQASVDSQIDAKDDV